MTMLGTSKFYSLLHCTQKRRLREKVEKSKQRFHGYLNSVFTDAQKSDPYADMIPRFALKQSPIESPIQSYVLSHTPVKTSLWERLLHKT